MERSIPPVGKKLLQPISSSVRKSSHSWIGSTIVILGAVFLLFTPNEGQPTPHQRLIDTLFHNWFVMSGFTAAIWVTKRGKFGSLPSLIRVLATLLFALFLLVSMVDFVLCLPLWDLLKPFGFARVDAVSATVMGVFLLWGIGVASFIVRGTFRWFRRRYEHHGLAVGFGPLYFYFRRRRTS